MDLPTAGSTNALGPVGTTVQALNIPSPSSSIPQRTPIDALLLAWSCGPTPTRLQPLHTPSTTAEIIAEGALLLPLASLSILPPAKSASAKLTACALSEADNTRLQ